MENSISIAPLSIEIVSGTFTNPCSASASGPITLSGMSSNPPISEESSAVVIVLVDAVLVLLIAGGIAIGVTIYCVKKGKFSK